MYEGREIIPIQFLKALLPEPASLGPLTKGKTNIGTIATGVKDGSPKDGLHLNICDHEEAYAETGNQAISYTTGVPAMIGAAMVLTGQWWGRGVFNMEQLDPDPFMDMLNTQGLPWKVEELDGASRFLIGQVATAEDRSRRGRRLRPVRPEPRPLAGLRGRRGGCAAQPRRSW
jgi:saccharopine dehydrogenase (NAD+, L-lysine-forming)